jgi:hypothetical protein
LGNLRAILVSLILCIVVSHASSQVSYTLKPSSFEFAQTTVGLPSHNVNFVLTNTGTTSFTVQSISIDSAVFQLVTGWAPYPLVPTQPARYGINFVPRSAGTFTGNLIININGVNPIVIPLRGTAVATGAAVTLSTSSLTFTEAVGTTSPTQTVSVTNTGTSPVTVTAVNADPPFSVSGFALPAVLQPGNSFSPQVSETGMTSGSNTGLLTFSYDVLPASGVALSGSTTPAQSLVVSSFPQITKGAVGAPYLFSLSASGGTPPYSWALTSGSKPPRGLTLDSSGTITGTIASSVSLGSHYFVVQVTDSGSATAAAQINLPVGVPTGANCNNLSWNVANSSTPMVPLNDLGSGMYLGMMGGLYADGSNTRPAAHDAAGLALAQSIQPLDAAGNPDPNGLYGLLSIGMSSTAHTWDEFTVDGDADPSLSPHLVIARGAQPDAGAVKFADITSGVWSAITQFYLPQAGLTPYQVVAAWVVAVDGYPAGTFPKDMSRLTGEYESIARNLHTLFPNLKLVYYTSKFYDGYANGLAHPSYPEPYAYESGFAVKWAIQAQIDGDPTLNYDSTLGTVMAPWMSWGPYDWANGMLARSDGLTWSCEDVNKDGVHPTNPQGREKEANILLNFFKADDTTTPWFLSQ